MKDVTGKAISPGDYVFYRGVDDYHFAYVLSVELQKLKVLYLVRKAGYYVAYKHPIMIKVAPLIVTQPILTKSMQDAIEQTSYWKQANKGHRKYE